MGSLLRARAARAREILTATSTRLSSVRRASLAVVAAGTLVAADLVGTWLEGRDASELIQRAVVVLVAVAIVAWYVAATAGARSERREHALSARQESLLRNASDLILLVDRDGRIWYQSPSVESALAYGPDELLGTAIDHLVVSDDDVPLLEELAARAAGDPGTPTAHLERRVRRRDGRMLAVDVIGTRADAEAEPGSVIVTMHDVTRWKELEAELTRQAFHDPLTGLPNRALFIDRLEHALARRRRHAKGVAVLFLDLDDFKTVNDSLGHAAGDRLITTVAERVVRTIRPGDTAARLGGDEFALLLEDVDERQASDVAERVLAELEPAFDLGDRSVLMGASIGVALSSDELATASEMLLAADTAMYHAKDAGKGRHRVFEASMRRADADRLRLGADLRGAVERGELRLHYQPILDLASGRTTGMEALVRWQHPELGLLLPAAFIPLAERSGLIVDIGRFVLGEACRRARTWQQASPNRAIGISVNVSGVQLRDAGIVAAVSLALEQAELPPELLTLEITESVMALDDEAVIRRLRQLKGMGVRLAVDDFGTGFSSLSTLGRVPADLLKIDKAFVDRLPGASTDQALVRSIVDLAHSLGLSAAAEGVERQEQLGVLKAIGCDVAQGHLWAPALDERDADAHLLGHATIAFWTGYSGEELAVIEAAVADFERRNPSIRVEVVGGVHDDRILAALADGRGPNVITAFESDEFGKYAAPGALVDLEPYLERDGVDASMFIEATSDYTRTGGKRWALPLMADTYGLYYDRDALARSGLAGPPRTIAELASAARKLTTRRADGSLEVVGFNPLFGFYENTTATLGHLFGARWTNDEGRSCLAEDPAWTRLFRWQRALVEWYGYDDLRRFVDEVGDEWSTTNAFETGRLALMLDGEWRTAFIAKNGSAVAFGAAPLPVDDARPDLYGSGFINGTVIGIPAGVGQRDEAWELVKYLATDESALTRMSNGLRNIPSTKPALRSPDLARDPDFAMFLSIFSHPRSRALPITPLGTTYVRLADAFADRWQRGEIRDLGRALRELDHRIDIEMGRTRPPADDARVVAFRAPSAARAGEVTPVR